MLDNFNLLFSQPRRNKIRKAFSSPIPQCSLSTLSPQIMLKLRTAINDPLCGVHLLLGWTVGEHVLAVAGEYQEYGRLVAYIKCDKFMVVDDVRTWFWRKLANFGRPPRNARVNALSEALPKRPIPVEIAYWEPPPATLVLDQFDMLMRAEGSEQFVEDLCLESETFKNFNVIICIGNPFNAYTMLSRNKWVMFAGDVNKELMVQEVISEIFKDGDGDFYIGRA